MVYKKRKLKLDTRVDMVKKRHNACLSFMTTDKKATVEQLLKTVLLSFWRNTDPLFFDRIIH